MRASCFVAIAIFVVLVSAETWYISPFGNNNNSGSSPGDAFFDLHTALLAASPGDTVRVASGYYSGSSNIFLTLNGISLVGTSGSSVTVFEGTTSSRMDYIFQLTNGSSIQVCLLLYGMK